MGRPFNLDVVIRAFDKATAPIRAIDEKVRRLTAPVQRLGLAMRGIADASGLTRVGVALGNVGRATGGVARELAALGARASVLGFAGGVGFGAMVVGATKMGDALDELATRTGLSTDLLVKWGYVAQRAGVDSGSFSSAMDRLSKNLGEMRKATPSGPLVKFLEDVSPKLLAQLKRTKDTGQAMDLLIRAMGRIEDPTKRAAFAAAAFGKSGAAMGAIGEMSAAEIEKLNKRIDRLYGNMDKYIKESSRFNDAWDDLTIALTAVRNIALGEILPALTDLTEKVVDLVSNNREKIRAWAAEFGAKLPGRLEAIGRAFDRAFGAVEKVADALKPIGVAIDRVSEVTGKWELALGAAAVVLGGPVWRSLLRTGGELLRFGKEMFRATGRIAAFALAIGGIKLAAFTAAVAGVVGAATWVWEAWEPLGKLLREVWTEPLESLRRFFKELDERFANLPAMLRVPVEAVRLLFEGPLRILKEILEVVDKLNSRRWGFRTERAQPDPGAIEREANRRWPLPPGFGPDNPNIQPQNFRLPGIKSQSEVLIRVEGLRRGDRATVQPGGSVPVRLDVGYQDLEFA